MAKVLSRLKSIEKMMRPLVPLKDQVTMLETTIIKLGQQQLMNATYSASSMICMLRGMAGHP